LRALQAGGGPLWPPPGRGGGYGINVETTLPPLNFTPAEAAAIATALAATRAMPFAEAGRTALAKLTGAMAAAPRDTATRLVGQIRVIQGPDGPVGAASELLQRALVQGVAIELRYRDGQGRESERVVEPAGVFGTRSGWYLAAWCRLRQAPRAFRLDRIVSATLTDEIVPARTLDDVLPDLPFELAEPALM
jgi:predicted DNA-binding transcriptional regulator YafY